ncbi:hypothetical protein BH20ACT23_BH20ACT23_12670 [soil metagenome]
MTETNEPIVSRLDLAQAQWSLDQLPIEALPDIATEALVGGFDTPSMRQLAGVHQPYYWSAFPLFERMMNELGRPKLDRSKCLKMVVVVRLRGLLQGRAEPGPVARDIGRVWLVDLDASDEWDELAAFFQLGEEWEERLATWARPVEEIESAIREESQEVRAAYERDLGLA